MTSDHKLAAIFFICVTVLCAAAIWNYQNIRRMAFASGYCETLSPGRGEPVWMKCAAAK